MMLNSSDKTDPADSTKATTAAEDSDDPAEAAADGGEGASTLSDKRAQIRGRVQSIYKSLRGNNE